MVIVLNQLPMKECPEKEFLHYCSYLIGVTASNPAPGIAVWHQHNGEYHLGKSEPAGLAGNPMHHTAVALVREGYVVLCPDSLCFEERQDPTGKLKGGNYERFEFLREVVQGRCLAWKDIYDMKQSVSMLCERPEVRTDLIGCYGHSMGSTHAWLVGPLEPRLKCVIGNCCLPTYEAIEQEHLSALFPEFCTGMEKVRRHSGNCIPHCTKSFASEPWGKRYRQSHRISKKRNKPDRRGL